MYFTVVALARNDLAVQAGGVLGKSKVKHQVKTITSRITILAGSAASQLHFPSFFFLWVNQRGGSPLFRAPWRSMSVLLVPSRFDLQGHLMDHTK